MLLNMFYLESYLKDGVARAKIVELAFRLDVFLLFVPERLCYRFFRKRSEIYVYLWIITVLLEGMMIFPLSSTNTYKENLPAP